MPMAETETIVIDSDSEFEKDTDDMDTGDMDIEEFIPKDKFTIAEERKNAGNDQYKAQNYKEALKCYSDAIAMCPESAAFLGNRSACYMMMCEYKAALNDCRMAIALDNKFEKCYVRAAKCCLTLGDMVATEQVVKKWKEIEPNSDAVKSTEQQCNHLRQIEEKATQSYEKQDYRTAVYHAESALKIASACLKFKLLKAESLALLGRTDEANDLAVSCMMSDSTNADAVYVRGLCLYLGDNLEKGLTHFQRVLTLDPEHKKAKIMRVKAKNLKEKKENGNKLFKSGKFREAFTLYSEALEIDPLNTDTNSKILYNRALVNTKIGNIRDAIADCTNTLSKNANYLKALLLRAKCHKDMENFEEQVKDYEAALKLEKTAEIRNMLKEAKVALKRSKRKDYYKILGIDRNASDDEIKKAYRKRALVHHPDRHANVSEEEKREQEKKFKEVGEAYAVLSDPQKKCRFDNGQDMDDVDFDPSQMYRQFFHFAGDGGQTFSFF